MRCRVGEKNFVPPKTCAGDLTAVISDYIDGCLDRAVCRRIELHITRYVRCRICILTLRKTVHILRVRGSARVPVKVRVSLRRRLAACVKKTQNNSKKRKTR